jgi:hypothetical protein
MSINIFERIYRPGSLTTIGEDSGSVVRSASYPVSSFNSLMAAASAVSPASTRPAGSSTIEKERKISEWIVNSSEEHANDDVVERRTVLLYNDRREGKSLGLGTKDSEDSNACSKERVFM